MKRRTTGLVVALVLATFGTAILVAYVQSAHSRAQAGEATQAVLVVSKPVPKGTASASMAPDVQLESVPLRLRTPGAVTNLAELKGLVASEDLLPGEELVPGRFVSPEVAGRPGVAPGKVAVTVSLDPERALGGVIHGGDSVAVLVSFDGTAASSPGSTSASVESTHLILDQVPVISVEAVQPPAKTDAKTLASGAATQAPTGKFLVTLALDASAAERVVFAAEHGHVWLAGEPAPAATGGIRIVTKENVFQ